MRQLTYKESFQVSAGESPSYYAWEVALISSGAAVGALGLSVIGGVIYGLFLHTH